MERNKTITKSQRMAPDPDESILHSMAGVTAVTSDTVSHNLADHTLKISKPLTRFYGYRVYLSQTDQSPCHRQIPPTDPKG